MNFQHLTVPHPIRPAEIMKAKHGFRAFVVYMHLQSSKDTNFTPRIEPVWLQGKKLISPYGFLRFGLKVRNSPYPRWQSSVPYEDRTYNGFDVEMYLNTMANRQSSYRWAFKKLKDAEAFKKMVENHQIPEVEALLAEARVWASTMEMESRFYNTYFG